MTVLTQCKSFVLKVLQKKQEEVVCEVRGLGQSRLASAQQMGRSVQQRPEVQRRLLDLNSLWEEINQTIKTREQVRTVVPRLFSP